MKKNYLFVLAMIVIAVCGFTSCGSDDDNEKGGDEGGAIDVAGKSELYMNGKKMNVEITQKTMFTYDRYGGGSVGLSTALIFKDENDKEHSLILHFGDFEEAYKKEDIFSNVKIGDELTETSNSFYYELHARHLGSKYGITGGEAFEDCVGSVKITKLNKSDKAIRIDLKDIKVAKHGNNDFPLPAGERITFNGYIEGLVLN